VQVGYHRIVVGTLLLLWPLSGQPLVDEAQRQHRAHVHGVGTLNLVQEGNRVHIELEIPGMDIVGFEHQARTASQKQAVKDAVAVLKQGDALFRLNAEATCALDTAGVEVAMMDGEDQGEHGHKAKAEPHEAGQHKAHGDHHKDDKHAAESGESHAEFHAEYVFTCASPDRLQQLHVTLFDKFQGAQSLQVQAVTARQQSAQQIHREASVVRFDSP
jgi:Protein of unknown function (DUF2796)